MFFTDPLSVSGFHAGIFGDSLIPLLQSEFPEYSNLKLAFYKQLVKINWHLSSTLKTRTEHTIIHNINIAKMQLF